jgi:hypothetical protein
MQFFELQCIFNILNDSFKVLKFNDFQFHDIFDILINTFDVS